MSAGKKVLFALLAFAPLPFIGMYIYTIFSMVTDLSYMQDLGNTPGPPLEMFQYVGQMFLYIGLGGILALTGMIIYILDIVKNKKFVDANSSLKIVWLLIVILLSNIGMIVYFFAEIISRKEGEDYQAPPITDRTN